MNNKNISKELVEAIFKGCDEKLKTTATVTENEDHSAYIVSVRGHEVCQCKNNADASFVKAAIEISSEHVAFMMAANTIGFVNENNGAGSEETK